MNRRFAALLLLFALPALAADGPEPYGRQIETPEKMRPELQAAVADLQGSLRQMTGGEFAVSTEAATRLVAGIILRRAEMADVPAEALKLLPAGSREAFCLFPEGDRLWLVGRSDLALSHGVYRYLEALGCRWYFPSEKWTIIPKRTDIRLAEPLVEKPAFASRIFAGSGGFGGKLPVDLERKLEARWGAWQRRNRFGGEFQISGHSGEAFNLAHRQELEAHPQWRAMIGSERVPWSLTAKFCAGNPEVVEFYVQDRLATYRRQRQLDAESPRAWAVSVEPADGGGHCTAPESLALGSVSDRVFHVANQVAKSVRNEFPEGRVSLFAYNEHAAVPSIAIEPNVYVMVVPYAFQRTGLNPDQLLDAWSRKVPRLGIYDYWSIPDWTHDLPEFDPVGFGPERLRGWHRRGVDSFLCESTFSSGAMGPAWQIGSKLAWNPQTDARQLLDELVSDSFGPAATPMRRMLLRWADGFYLTSHELALSFRDLDEAWRLAESDPAIAPRVADYGRYVEYLRRRFEYQRAGRAPGERAAAARRLMEHIWAIYDSSMIHSFRESQLLARDENTAGNPELLNTYVWNKPTAPIWPMVRPITDDEVRKLVELGVRELTPSKFAIRKFSGPLTPAVASPLKPASGEFTPAITLSNSVDLRLQINDASQPLRLRIGVERPVQVMLSDEQGRQVATQSVATGVDWGQTWSEPEFKLSAPGLYQVQIVSQKRPFRLSLPADVPLSLAGWWNSQGAPTPRLHFYVPRDIDRLAIYAPYIPAGPPRFFNPAGQEVKPELIDGGHLILLDIPPADRGQVWSFDRAKCALGPFQLLNVPAAFAFTPETLLVPADALKP